MQNLLRRLFPWQIRWKGVLLELALFLAAYITWAIFRSPQSPGRLVHWQPGGAGAGRCGGAAGIPVPAGSAVRLPAGLALAGLGAGVLVAREPGAQYLRRRQVGSPVPIFSPADVLSFLAYPLFFLALIMYPFENRYAPSRFRFLLDVTISAGVVATLVGLMLGRPGQAFSPAAIAPLVYPIADLILLAILFNMLLANRRPAGHFSCGAADCLLSWYLITSTVCLPRSMDSRQAGWRASAGWPAGLFLDGGRFSRQAFRLRRTSRSERLPTWVRACRTSCRLPSCWRWAGWCWPNGA